MSAPKAFDFTIYQGSTLTLPVRWESDTIAYAAITAIAKTAPVQITAVGHGIPNGWWGVVTSVRGMTQINAANTPPKDKDYKQITVIDADTVEINVVNSIPFGTYTSGGVIQYNEPVDLTGYTARMTIRPTVDSDTVIDTLTTEDARLPATGITLDLADSVIVVQIAATVTDDYDFASAVYDLEMVGPDGAVYRILEGTISLSTEVTR